jgi:hypothetical protein
MELPFTALFVVRDDLRRWMVFGINGIHIGETWDWNLVAAVDHGKKMKGRIVGKIV